MNSSKLVLRWAIENATNSAGSTRARSTNKIGFGLGFLCGIATAGLFFALLGM